MKYIFELNSRTELAKSVELKHEQTIAFLKKANKPWGIDKNQNILFPGFGLESTAILSLNKFVGQGIKCTVFYRYRNLLEDNSLCDDRIYIEFNAKKNDYEYLTSDVLPFFVKGFNAYRAVVYDKELMFYDFERSRNVNLRNTIIRFYPICFYDEELCLRAIGMSSKGVFDKLANKIDKVTLFDNGIFINKNDTFFSIDEANKLDLEISSLLNIERYY